MATSDGRRNPICEGWGKAEHRLFHGGPVDEDRIRVSNEAEGLVAVRDQLCDQWPLRVLGAEDGDCVRLPREGLHHVCFVALAIERHEVDRRRCVVLHEESRKGHGPYGRRGRAIPVREPAEYAIAVREALPEGLCRVVELKKCLAFSTGHGGGNHFAAADLQQTRVVLWVGLDAEPFPPILLL